MLLILVILSSLQRHCFATDDSSAPNGAGDCVEDVRHPEHPSHQPSTQKNGARRCNEVEDTRRTLWEQHSCRRQERQYQIIAAEACEDMARRMEYAYPDRFTFFPTKWDKFPDDTDDIEIGGFAPYNNISGKHVLFLASFHNNGVTMSQFQVLISLLQSFISSLTVILPYYPVGTMERVTREGTVATAATYAHMFSSLPNCGKPTRLMLYDLHTLQNRFYLVRCLLRSRIFPKFLYISTAIPLL